MKAHCQMAFSGTPVRRDSWAQRFQAVMARDFADNSAARLWVWDRLSADGVARFPFTAARPDPEFRGRRGGGRTTP